MSTKMRAKMRVSNIEKHGETNETLTFNAIGKPDGYPEDGADENNTFAKFTPAATLSIQIANPALIGKFAVDETFYVDFTPAD